MAASETHNRFSRQFVNLAQPRLGARVVYATDDFFAPCERMLNPAPAEFIPGLYDDHGKWMDGWESRRKRGAGYDHSVVRLGLAGRLHGVDIDTSHFIGNHPPAASVDACYCDNGDPAQATVWVEVLPKVSLGANSHHLFDIQDTGFYSHVRLNIYPDGGVARFRVYGETHVDWSTRDHKNIIDLVAIENGGRAVACSEEAFGSTMLNLNLPGRGVNMGDGWETSRRRGPGWDWVILALGHAGLLEAIELDTAHYKGNFPDRVSVQGIMADATMMPDALIGSSANWPMLLGEQAMSMDAVHHFQTQLLNPGPVTHVRVNMIPDGGLSRVRILGRLH